MNPAEFMRAYEQASSVAQRLIQALLGFILLTHEEATDAAAYFMNLAAAQGRSDAEQRGERQAEKQAEAEERQRPSARNRPN